jgi:hypothetical protein
MFEAGNPSQIAVGDFVSQVNELDDWLWDTARAFRRPSFCVVCRPIT